MGVYYHYTDQDSLKKIKQSRRIRKSVLSNKDAIFGEGVYLTKLDPRNANKFQIALNNYDEGWLQGLIEGKIDCYIKINIPGSRVEQAPSDRDIYVYPNADIHLDNYNWSSGDV